MKRSQRGAARISAVWMIAVIVAFFVSMAVAFVAFDESGTLQADLDETKTKLAEAQASLDTELDAIRAISEIAGFYDDSTASARSEPAAMSEGLSSLKDAYPDMDPSIDTLQAALPVVIASFNGKQARIRDLESNVTQAQADAAAKDQTIRDITSSKDRELAALQSQLSDAEQAWADEKSGLERQVASVRSELTTKDSDYRGIQNDLDDLGRQMAEAESQMRARFNEMSRKLQFEREPEAPDGEVLAVSPDLALGWINLGAHNRLARGTRFRVVSGTPGDTRIKAWAEVQRVEARMAEVRFVNQSDPFDPPVEGDIVFNPLYDPYGQRNAVLAGRFSGTFNEKELRALMSQIGIHVQPTIDLTTDYLIVGQEIYTDPETLEPLEEPLQPSDLAEYKDAVAQGLAIVPIKDVRTYFKN
jgi:hypothetical protein